MALPSSGPMSLSMIQGEFGGPSPILLSNYYRGGSYVPNTSVNSKIPTSGIISLSEFYGASKGDAATMVAGVGGSTIGYNQGLYGSYNPANLSDGHQVTRLTDDGTHRLLWIGAFAVDPGASYLNEIIVNGTAFTVAASTYAFQSGGVASWSWPQPTPEFVNGSSYNVSVSHN